MRSVHWQSLSFAEPLWLLGLALVLVLWTLRQRHAASRGLLASRLALLGRCAAVVATVLALSQPEWTEQVPDRERMLLLDRSGSAEGVDVDALIDPLNAPSTDGAEGLKLGRVDYAPSPSAGTDLTSLIEEGIGALEGSADSRLVLISDGAHSGPPLGPVLELARAKGIPIDTLALPGTSPRWTLSSLDLPDEIQVGEEQSLVIRVDRPQAWETGRREGGSETRMLQLELRVADKLLRSNEVDPRGGEARVKWRPTVAGLQVLELRLLTGSELLASTTALVRVRARERALVVGPPAARELIRHALVTQSSPLKVVGREELSEPPYDDYRFIYLADPDFASLPQGRVDGLVEWTRAGGRLLVSSGESGLVVDDPRLDGIAELLPVRFPKTKKKEQAPLSVIYCLDRSDSMAGAAKFELAAAALAQSLHLLPEGARIGIVGFADFPTWILPFGELPSTQAAINALTGVEIKGGTSIYHGLQEAWQALRHDDSMVKHVVVLSDGQSTTTFSRHGDVVNLMRGQNITVTTIAVSEDSDRSEMERIARAGNGRAHYAENFRELPKLFLDEMMIVTRTNKVEEEVAVYPIEGSRMLEGLAEDMNWPSLRGYVRGRQKAGSELALATEEGHPLLAAGRFGRGSVVLFASELGGGWTADWQDWAASKKLWRGVVQRALQVDPADELKLRTWPAGDSLRLEVEAVDALRNPRGDLLVEAMLESPEGPAQVWTLAATGPGRYGGLLEIPDDDPRLLRVAAVGTTDPRSPAPPYGEVSARVRRPPPLEERLPPSNHELLRWISEESGGRSIERVGETLDGEARQRARRRRLWPELVKLALALLVLDVGLRRIGLARGVLDRLLGRSGDRSVPSS